MLKVDIATKYYKEYVGLQKFNLDVGAGEVVGILGTNGAGKTTLFKAIMNLTNLNIGGVTVDGEPVHGEVYKKLAFISEEGTYFKELTIEEHKDFYNNLYDGFDCDRYDELIKFFELPTKKRAGTLSKGQRSKLEIAIGLSKGAKYILMDEPFMGKDIFTRKDFLKLMIAKLKEDESIIIATHLIDEIQNFLTRVVIIHEGRKKCDISMEELEDNNINLIDFMKEVLERREVEEWDE